MHFKGSESVKVTAYQDYENIKFRKCKPYHHYKIHNSFAISEDELKSWDESFTHILFIYNDGRKTWFYVAEIEQYRNTTKVTNYSKVKGEKDIQFHVSLPDMVKYESYEEVEEQVVKK